MRKLVAMTLLVIGAAAVAMAQTQTPEVDATSITSGLALIGGLVLVIRGRKK